MKHILFLLDTIDINASANGICVQAVIDALHRVDNLEITCIACSEPNTLNYTEKRGCKIFRVKRPPISSMLRSSENNKAGIKHKVAMMMYHLEKIILYHYWPGEYPLLTRRILSRAISLYKQKPFYAVISVYKNIENIYAAQKLKILFPKIKHIVYFLDPLSCGYRSKYYSNKYIDKKSLKLEKAIISVSDYSIYMRSNWNRIRHEYENQRELLEKVRISDLPIFMQNSENRAIITRRENHPLKIVYTGSIPKGIRTPLPFLRILEKSRANAELHIVGDGDFDTEIDAFMRKNGLNIIMHGRVSADEAAAIRWDADILLNLGNDFSSFMLPSKIFEYMSTGKPIVSTYSQSDDQSLNYLGKYPYSLMLNTNNSDDDNATLLASFLSDNYPPIDTKILSDLFEENCPAHTVKTIVDCLARSIE